MDSQTQWNSIQTPSEPITPERQSSPGLSDPFSQSLSINQTMTITKKIEDLAEIARQIAHSKEILLQWIISIMKEALDMYERTSKQDRQGNTADDRRPTPYPQESLEPMELSNDDDQHIGTVTPERQPLEDITPTGVTSTTGTFATLTTHAAICNRIDHICIYTGRNIHPEQRRRTANCWKLISDRRIAAAIVDRARKIFNWNCANLIDVFTNFAELQWNAPIIPAGSLDQFGFIA